MIPRNFWVDVENSAGVKYGSGPLRGHGFTHKKPLSASGEFSFVVSAADPNLAALVEKRVAICRYIDETGAVVIFGGGVIDKIVATLDETGALVYQVSGNDLTRELTYRSVGALKLASGSAGVTNGPALVMALAPAGWSLTGSATATPVYAGFDGESCLSGLCKISDHIGEHWRLGSGRTVAWLGPASGFASSGVRAVQHTNDPVAIEGQTEIAIIASLEEQTDAADVVTRIIPRGSGNGGAITTLAAATDSAPAGYTLDLVNNCLINTAAEAAYGRIERVVDFKGLGPLSNTTLDVQNASNALLLASYTYLERYKAPVKFYGIKLAFVNRLLEPGTTIRVVYRKLQDGVVLKDLDGVFNILSVEQTLDETGLHTTQIGVSTIDRQPESDSSYLAGQAQESKVLGAHQQLGASVDNLSYRDELDSDNPSSFRFWLGDEYTVVQRAVLRFRIQKLRSTVKSVGSSSTTTSSGGSSSPTSSSGGGTTATSSSGGAHGHAVTVYNGLSGTQVNFDGTFLNSGLPTGVFYTQAATPGDHTHGVTVPSHTHSVTIPDHTHTVTPVITMTYGLFEESAGNTLGIADLVIKLNGSSNLAGAVSDVGNGWYALDITATLVSAIFRPVQENNEIVISTATTGKTARIEAQLTVRGVVQAVAYS